MTGSQSTRLTYWLTADERAHVLELAVTAWKGKPLQDESASTLVDVVTELDVAAARALFNTGTVRVGYAKDGPGGATLDTKPVCFSQGERDAVLALSGLSETVRGKLR